MHICEQKLLAGCVGTLILVSSILAMAALPSRGQDKAVVLPEADEQLVATFLHKSPVELLSQYFQDPPYPLFAIRRIIELGDPVVILQLERAFAREDRELTRQFLAAALVSLGDSHPEYFNYLASRAAIAVASDLPFPIELGNRTRPDAGVGVYKGEFLSWIRRHGNKLEPALWQAAFDLPGAVEALGEAADRRSRPILLRGLKSPNVLVVFEAALGLARLQEKGCVPSIISAAKRMSGEERKLIAKTLLYFADPAAQRGAERLIDDFLRLQRWRTEVNKRGWKAAMRDNGH